MDKKEKQQKLEDFYKKKFTNIDLKNNYSSPHLISLNSELINTDIMIVGQETNSWHGNISDFKSRGIEKQMNIYDDFIYNHYKNMSNIFLRYVKNIIKNDNIVPVWTNLFKFDLGDQAKDKNISKASNDEYNGLVAFHDGILAKEIEIIQPKIIIFFTGHKYDKLYFDPIVKKKGDYKNLYLPIKGLNNIDEWKYCQMNLKEFNGFETFKGIAYRTYHPIYLNRNLEKFGNKIIEHITNEITKTQ